MPWLPALLLFYVLTGCATLTSSATSRLANNLATAILNQNDLATVQDGAPAYLLMLDGLIEGEPNDGDLLLTGAKLYGAYATAFVDDEARARRLTSKARAYGLRALCLRRGDLCHAVDRPFEEFLPALQTVNRSDVPALYGFTAAWAGWVQANAQDWNAIAEVPKIEATMRRVIELDETYEGGGAHVVLGVLSTQLPPSLGGKPDAGRQHFEQAITLAEGRNLMAKVLYAKQYARLVFDRALHDRLLREVLAAEPKQPGLTLSNTLAQKQAQELLDGADAYFE